MTFIAAFFAWRTVKDTGVNVYQQNAVTGRRRVLRAPGSGYQPVDTRWLAGGDWSSPTAPPVGPSPILPSRQEEAR
jgi:hypothetical protein